MTCADLTDTRHPGDEQLAKEFVLYWHLSEEIVDFVVFTICSVSPFSDYVRKNKTGLCKKKQNTEDTERWVLVKDTRGKDD